MRKVLALAIFQLVALSNVWADFSGYFLSRVFLDVKRENELEDWLEVRNRLFAEVSASKGRTSLVLSARVDLNFFTGKFSTSYFSFRPFEFYAVADFDKFTLTVGRQVVSWGKTDGSPFDIINRPDFTDGFFTEQRFTKVPGLLLNFATYFGDSTLQIVWEPFFTPPDFFEVNSDWALLNWSSIARSRGIGEDDERIRAVLNGTFDPFLEEYPEKITELLLSFGLGVRLDTLLGETGLAFYLYTGFEQFPTLYFNPSFRADLASQPGDPLANLSTLDAAEVIVPVAQGENFVTLRPSRYYALGIGVEREFEGFLFKADTGFFLDVSALEPFLDVVEWNFFVFSGQVEKQFGFLGFDVFPVAGARVWIPVPARRFLIFEEGLFLPSVLLRFERWLGGRQVVLTGAVAWDFVIGQVFEGNFTARSLIAGGSTLFSLTDNFSVEAGVLYFDGKRISLFGFFRENSAYFLNARLSF